MQGIIDPQNKTLGEVFSSNKITIPPYQRTYVWKKKQIEPFVNSIIKKTLGNLGSRRAKEIAFIGPIVVYKTDRAGSRSDLIDGQQRLTTLMLVLFALKQCIAANGEALGFSEDDLNKTHEKLKELAPQIFPSAKADNFRVNNLIAEPVKNLLLERYDKAPKSAWKPFGTSQRVKDLKSNFDIIYKIIETLVEEEFTALARVDQRRSRIIAFVETLLKTVKVLEISTTNEADALELFVNLNYGGSQLDESDIVKAQVFIEFTKKGASDSSYIADPDNFDVLWQGITKTVESAGASLPGFMFQWLLGRPETNISQQDQIVEAFKSVVEGKPGANANQKMQAAMKEMQTAATLFHEISSASCQCESANFSFLRSSFIGDAYRILALRLLIWAGPSRLDTNKWPKEIVELIETTEKAYFRMAFVGNLPQRISDAIQKATAELTGEYSPATVRRARAVLIDAASSLPSKIDNGSIRKYFDEVPGSKGRRYYVLFREAFDSVPAKMAEYVIPAVKFQIEHIIPVNYSKNWGGVVEAFPSGGGPFRYIQNWGNLCLLDKHTNNAIKDKSWEEKKLGPNKVGETDTDVPCYKNAEPNWVRENLAKKATWSFQDVEARRKKLAELIVSATTLS
jgi:Protein of unknown function DUF262/Protein of unknown function (DUF1524)